MNWCPKIADPKVRDANKLQKVKEELVEMSPYFGDMSKFYQSNNSDYIAVNHANLQADNAWFWRNELGELDVGVLDYGGFGRAPFALKFSGCITGADPEVLLAHVEGICQ